MLKDKMHITIDVAKRIANDAVRITKNNSIKAVNSGVRATKTSTQFIATKAEQIPQIGQDQ